MLPGVSKPQPLNSHQYHHMFTFASLSQESMSALSGQEALAALFHKAATEANPELPDDGGAIGNIMEDKHAVVAMMSILTQSTTLCARQVSAFSSHPLSLLY